MSQAKSRLAERPDLDRGQLALAFAKDTVAAVRSVELVELVVVVTSDVEIRDALADDALIVEEPPGAGLRESFAAGAARVRSAAPDLALAGLVADLAALRPYDLSVALEAAGGHRRAFVVDAAGTGTTMLTAGPGQAWQAFFGPSSADLHRACGAVAIDGPLESLRLDVDTVADLVAAQALGVGVATAALLERASAATSIEVQATVLTFDEDRRAGSAVTDVGEVVEIPAGSLVGARLLRSGQRVVVCVKGGRSESVRIFGSTSDPHAP